MTEQKIWELVSEHFGPEKFHFAPGVYSAFAKALLRESDVAAELGLNEHPASAAQPGFRPQLLVVSPTSRSLMEHRAAQKEFERIRQTPPT